MFFKKRKIEQRLHKVEEYNGNTKSLFDDFTKNSAISIPSVFNAVNLISSVVASTSIEDAPKPLDREPQENMTRYVWLSTIVKNILLHGNSFAKIKDSELMLLDPKATSAFYDKNNQTIVYYQYMNEKIYPEDILHFRNVSKDNIGQMGTSSLVNFANSFSRINVMNDYQGNFMVNAVKPSVWLEHPSKLRKETLTELKENFSSLYSGINKAGSAPVLSEGIQLKELKSTSVIDADLVALKQATLKEIAMIFNIPVSMLDNSLANYSNAVEANLNFLKMTINPLLTNIKEEINLKLNSNMNFDTSSFIEGSFEQKINTLTSAVAGGILTANEARARLKYKELDSGNKLFNPAGTPKEADSKSEGNQNAM